MVTRRNFLKTALWSATAMPFIPSHVMGNPQKIINGLEKIAKRTDSESAKIISQKDAVCKANGWWNSFGTENLDYARDIDLGKIIVYLRGSNKKIKEIKKSFSRSNQKDLSGGFFAIKDNKIHMGLLAKQQKGKILLNKLGAGGAFIESLDFLNNKKEKQIVSYLGEESLSKSESDYISKSSPGDLNKLAIDKLQESWDRDFNGDDNNYHNKIILGNACSVHLSGSTEKLTKVHDSLHPETPYDGKSYMFVGGNLKYTEAWLIVKIEKNKAFCHQWGMGHEFVNILRAKAPELVRTSKYTNKDVYI